VDLFHCKPPTQLDKTPLQSGHTSQSTCGTWPSSRTLDNPHLGLSGQRILVHHLTHYKLTGPSLLYQLQTGWLASITTLIVPIADQVARIYCKSCELGGQWLLQLIGWLASITTLIVPIADQVAGMYCHHCKLSSQQLLYPLWTQWPEYIVTIANWMANIHCTHCRLDGHSLWGDPKLGLWMWIWMVYIIWNQFFLGDSESEDLLDPLQIKWPFIMRWS